MKGTYLGEFEEVVLLAIAIHSGKAYGAAVTIEIEKRMDRSVSLGAVHSAMHRLEQKGLVNSQFGGNSAERGGRSKRLYTITSQGQFALQEVRQLRNAMWETIPNISLS